MGGGGGGGVKSFREEGIGLLKGFRARDPSQAARNELDGPGSHLLSSSEKSAVQQSEAEKGFCARISFRVMRPLMAGRL